MRKAIELRHRLKRLKGIHFRIAACDEVQSVLEDSSMGRNISEGIRTEFLYQLQSNWISYRSSCEELRHEKYLWLAKAGHYADAKEPDRLLAERVESIVSTEHAKWVSAQKKVDKKKRHL